MHNLGSLFLPRVLVLFETEAYTSVGFGGIFFNYLDSLLHFAALDGSCK